MQLAQLGRRLTELCLVGSSEVRFTAMRITKNEFTLLDLHVSFVQPISPTLTSQRLAVNRYQDAGADSESVLTSDQSHWDTNKSKAILRGHNDVYRISSIVSAGMKQ